MNKSFLMKAIQRFISCMHFVRKKKKRFVGIIYNTISKIINTGMCLTGVKYTLLSYYLP